ncbi:hypothetical protein PFISCL1PPCAC_7178 [Pristionchus fissidentatus]|uniref:Uncharacterized protein n=1 Tax=Pristionchus fissidentatus TaxID=1538716 RepID=A0AAV5V946_9BILA|nr:hypothetical protein PFISCL1PPCAC_7178 [Pristionchus fissidentatus]
MADSSIRRLALLSIVALSLLSETACGMPLFDSMNNKIGNQRKLSISAVVACFQKYNAQSAHLEPSERKRYYASTSGATAVLYDEDGNEMDCDEPVTKPEDPPRHKYDQHCFFSPLNCFFSKYRLPENTSTDERGPEYDVAEKRRS